MKIKLDKYVIKSDNLNVIVTEKYMADKLDEDKNVVGQEEKQKLVGYYSNPKQALRILLDKDLMNGEAEGIEAILEAISRFEGLVSSLDI